MSEHEQDKTVKFQSESESESDTISDIASVNIDEFNAEQLNDDEDEPSIENILASTLSTPEGDTICSALVNMGYQIEIQNKILVKLLSILQKK
tara:strand:+ start:1629 stop:1907 length:279 start_codon:yes stop_codon:yes gene_type:complete